MDESWMICTSKRVCFAFLLRSWVLRTFWVGYRRDLEVTDLYTPLKEHTSGILGVKIAKAWKKEYEAYQRRLEQSTNSRSQKKVKEPSLMKVLIRCFGFKTLLYGIFMAVMEILLRYIYNLLHFFPENPAVKFQPNFLHFLWCLDKGKKQYKFLAI